LKRKHFGVIGLGRFGSAIAMTLTELGHDVIGIDGDEARVQEFADFITHTLQIDATDEKALRAAGFQDVDVAVVSIGEDIESSVLVVMQLHELGIQTIVAKAVTPLHGRILEKLGVSRVISPEREMGVRVAHSLVMPNVLDYIELSRDFSIVELPAPAAFAGQTLLAIKRESGPSGAIVTNVAPAADETIRAGDVLVLLGSNERLNQLDQLLPR
jgi:trk system potassium uptake protein TrkA